MALHFMAHVQAVYTAKDIEMCVFQSMFIAPINHVYRNRKYIVVLCSIKHGSWVVVKILKKYCIKKKDHQNNNHSHNNVL